MRIYNKFIFFLFICLFLHNQTQATSLSNQNLISIATINELYQENNLTNFIPPYLASFPRNTNIAPLIATESIPSSTNSIRITGDIIFDATDPNAMTIALPNSINDARVTGNVVINLAPTGTLIITVGGSPYPSGIPGLTVTYTNSTNNFNINSPLIITGSIATVNNAIVTINGSLSVTANDAAPQTFAAFDDGTTLTITGDTLFDGNSLKQFCNEGTINSTGEIIIQNNIGSDNAVNIGGPITSSSNVTINNNICTEGAGNGANIQATLMGVNITINNNHCNDTNGTGLSISSTLTATGTLDISNNSSPAGSSAVYLTNATIQATGAVTMNNNNGRDSDTESSSMGIFFYNSTLINAATLTMNNNNGGNVPTSNGIRVQGSTILSTGNIILNNNMVTASDNPAVGIFSFDTESVIKTNGTITIIVNGESSQTFDSSVITIKNLSNVALPFTNFIITIDSNSYGNTGGNYTAMQTAFPDIIILSADNQA